MYAVFKGHSHSAKTKETFDVCHLLFDLFDLFFFWSFSISLPLTGSVNGPLC